MIFVCFKFNIVILP